MNDYPPGCVGGALACNGIMRALKILALAVGSIVLFAAGPLIYQFASYYASLEQEVVTRFSGQHWTLPSLLYSDSTMLYPGERLDEIGFFQRLARLNYHRVDPGQVRLRGEYSFDQKQGTLVLFLHGFRYPYYDFAGALVTLKISPLQTIESIEDVATGKPEYRPSWNRNCSAQSSTAVGNSGGWCRCPIFHRRLSMRCSLPRTIAFTNITASTFAHTRAAWIDLTAHHVLQGGSTLTQQLMKNFFLTSKRDWHRKITEALMAYIAEALFEG